MMARRWMRALATAAVCALALAGCAGFPVDTEGTLDRVREGTLRVGITHSPPWTDTSGRQPAGTEVELVEALADELDADIAWTIDSEAQLMEAIHAGALDLVIGGITDDTPWTDKGAVTRPYVEAPDASGQTRKHLFVTRAGENRFLVAVETFLDEQAVVP